MDATRAKQVIIAQADPGTSGELDDTEPALTLPVDFANRAGWLAHINQITLIEIPQKYPGVDVTSIINKQGGVRERLLTMKQIRPMDGDFSAAIKTLSGMSTETLNVQGIRVIINNPFDEYGEQEAAAAKSQLEAYASQAGTIDMEIRRIVNTDTEFRNEFNKMMAMTTQRGVTVPPVRQSSDARQVLSQAQPPMPEAAPDGHNPMSVEKFESVEQLRQALIMLGPTKETYDRLFDLVGPDSEDSAKSALAKFFEGSPGGLCVLYDLLVKAGVASPVDQQTIGDLMETHPNIFPKQAGGKVTLKVASAGFVVEHADGRTLTVSKEWDFPSVAKAFGWTGNDDDHESAKAFLAGNDGKQADDTFMFGENHAAVKASFHGLYLPPNDSSLKTMEKVASGGVGSTINQNYSLAGPEDRRMCPKIRNVVSTFTCRYHCLDGLVIDDHQVLCGEAIWRQSVMDKFSREYRDADGNWVGGYIDNRFEVDRVTHEHPALLKPGQRNAPINEDAWSTEKRLQEMRRDESGSRDYSQTPGDPKDVYNFDQHDLTKGPKSPNLSGKDKDPISKMASVVEVDSMFKVAGDPAFQGVEWAEPEPQEGMEDAFNNDSLSPLPPGSIAAGTWEGDHVFRDIKGGFWAAGNEGYGKQLTEAEVAQFRADCEAGVANCTVPFGPSPMPQAQAKKKFNLSKKAQIAPPPGGSHAMGDFDKVGQRAERCSNPNCKKVCKMGTGACPNCGSKTVPYHMSEIMTETKAIPAPAIMANGVYRVIRDGKAYFGATLQEAQMKAPVPMAGGSVQEEANMLENIIQEDTVEPQTTAQPQQATMDVATQQPASDPMGEVVPAVSDDLEGGIEEDLGLTPHVDAGSLDEHLMQDMASEEPGERQNRTEEFASYGLGADPKDQA